MDTKKRKISKMIGTIALSISAFFAYGFAQKSAQNSGYFNDFATVKVYAEEGENTEEKSATFDFGNGETTNEKPTETPVYKNYTFDGWYTDLFDDLTRLAEDDAGEADTTYYARWKNGSKYVATQPIDFTAETESTDVLSMYGFSWNAEENTLTLNGFYFDGAADFAVKLPDSATLKIEGKNTIIFSASGDGAAVVGVKKLKIIGNGKLTITASGDGTQSLAALSVAGDLEIGASGDSDFPIGSGTSGDLFGGDTDKQTEKSAPTLILSAENGGEVVAFRCGRLTLINGFITAKAGERQDITKASVGFRSKTLTVNGGILTASGTSAAFILDVLPTIGTYGLIRTPKQSSGGSAEEYDYSASFAEGIDGDIYGEATTVCTLTNTNGENVEIVKNAQIYLHKHSYDQNVAEEIYFIEGATCQHGTIYYVSCMCGEAGEAVFELSDKLSHVDKDGDERCDECGTKIKTPMTSKEIVALSLGVSVLVLIALYFLGYFLLYRRGKLDGETSEIIYKWLPKGKKKSE